jgi:hypothetical protein
MKPWRTVINLRWAARVLAWSALMAITVLLALLLQTLAAGALVASRSTEPPTACQSAADKALLDGNYVDTRFLAELCRTAIAPPPSR